MIKELAQQLTPPDTRADPTAWRWKMYVSVIGLAAVVALHILASAGHFPGISGTANAADITEVNRKIDSVQLELRAEIAEVKSDVAEVAESQNTLLRLAIAQDICRIYWLRMNAEGLLLQTLNDSFDRQQDAYEAINDGVRYPAIECGPQR